jgi:hypothetical protein
MKFLSIHRLRQLSDYRLATLSGEWTISDGEKVGVKLLVKTWGAGMRKVRSPFGTLANTRGNKSWSREINREIMSTA